MRISDPKMKQQGGGYETEDIKSKESTSGVDLTDLASNFFFVYWGTKIGNYRKDIAITNAKFGYLFIFILVCIQGGTWDGMVCNSVNKENFLKWFTLKLHVALHEVSVWVIKNISFYTWSSIFYVCYLT